MSSIFFLHIWRKCFLLFSSRLLFNVVSIEFNEFESIYDDDDNDKGMWHFVVVVVNKKKRESNPKMFCCCCCYNDKMNNYWFILSKYFLFLYFNELHCEQMDFILSKKKNQKQKKERIIQNLSSDFNAVVIISV